MFYYISEFFHYFLVLLYFILPFLNESIIDSKYFVYYPLFFIILVLDWNDHDGSCWITKLSTYLNGKKEYSSNFKPIRKEKIEGDSAGYKLMSFFGISMKDQTEETKEQNIKRANYYLLIMFAIPSIVSLFRVYNAYNVPFEPITSGIVFGYFSFYLIVTYLID